MTKLVLHIGTHKTATTSIQHCCALNRPILEKFGILYPHPRVNSYEFNYLAADIAFNRRIKAQKFFEKTLETAKKKKLHTVLISAESFYAMTGIFHGLHKKIEENYWDQEKQYVAELKDMLCMFESVTIKAVFRPQDELASSLYNQTIKNSLGAWHSYEDFLEKTKHVFDYNGHIKLWENAFGKENVEIAYMAPGDMIFLFFSNLLTKNQLEQLAQKEFSSNERLTRDVMEYKKILNKQLFDTPEPDRALGFISARILRQITSQFPDQSGYQIFAPLSARQTFWKDYERGNIEMAERYRLPVLNPLTRPMEQTYPGLSGKTKKIIEQTYQTSITSGAIRAELFIRRVLRKAAERDFLRRGLVDPLRTINNYMRLKLQGW